MTEHPTATRRAPPAETQRALTTLQRALMGAELSAFLNQRLAGGEPTVALPNRLVCLGPPSPAAAGASPTLPLPPAPPPHRTLPNAVGRRWCDAATGTVVLFQEGLLSLSSARSDEEAVQAMVEQARRRGWRRLGACGHAEFRQRVAARAAALGLDLLMP